MSGFAAKYPKEKRIHPTTSGQKVSVPYQGDMVSEKIAAERDAFWAEALESASILLWIVTHSPSPEQHASL